MALTVKWAGKGSPPISSIGNNKLRVEPNIRQAGFTLVEIMVVLVMVGLLSSTVILTMPKEKPAIQTFAPKFQLTLNRAAQSSVLSGQMVALGLSKDGYSVLKYDHEDWVPIASEEWPHGVLVSFDKEKTPIKLSEDIQPIAVFEPTGLATIFSLKLADIDHSYIFESAGDGRVTIQALK